MRDAYQNILTKYPTLTTFKAVAADEGKMITALYGLLAKYKIALPTDAKVSAANTIANGVTSISKADTVAISLEQSTATLITRLLQTADNQDVATVEALIKTTSLGSHTTAFATEKTAVATPSTPPPATRPFPAPVTTRTVTVPASIDPTGMTDVSTALVNFILGVPNGTLINFPSAAVYRIDKAIEFEGRHNLIIDGNGCTLKYTSVTGTDTGYSLWYNWHNVVRGSDIWIRNFVLIGSSPYPGVFTPGDSPTGGENQCGVIVTSDRTEVSGCTISAVWGDGLYVGEGPTDVWFHNNHVISAGRQGLSVISATNVIAERNAFDKVGFYTFDVEPNYATDSCTNIIFRNNTAGTYGTPGSGFDPYVFGVTNYAKTTIDGIVIDGNTVTDSSIATYIDCAGTVRMTHITFTNNVGKVAAAGSVLYFKHVDGLTVTGNLQPLTLGVLTRITDCTGVR
jgi:hypothetical protein